MKAIIVLKCDGRKNNGFRYCSGVENVLLDLETIRATENYSNLIRYLDSVVKLFDGPCFKFGVVSNTVYKLVEMGYIDEKVYQHIVYYFEMHKRCGIHIAIIPKE